MVGIATKDITLSVMTLRGAGLRERIEAASKAGFTAIGLRLSDYLDVQASGITADGIDALLAEAGIHVKEIEFLREWVGRGQDPTYQRQEKQLFAMAAHFKARHINVGVFEYRPKNEVVSSFAGVCQRAAKYGLIVQLEFMPYTPPVNTLQKACAIVQAAAQPNAGLLIDIWHFARTPGSTQMLKKVPPDLITGIQVGDVRVDPFEDITEEARHYREVPGEGVLNVAHFLGMLQYHGVQAAALSVEVMSDALDLMLPPEAAERVAQGLRVALNKPLAAPFLPYSEDALFKSLKVG